MKNLLLFAFILAFSSCSLSYRVLLGVDVSPDWLEKNDLEKLAKKHKIPAENNFVLDTASYQNGLKAIYQKVVDSLKIAVADSAKKQRIKKALNDDQQPAQFRLFTKNGREIFKLVNCYIDPPIPMNWNVDGCFDVFPPKTSYETLDVHRFDLSFLLTHLKSVNGENISAENLPMADYYGVIFWNDFYKRPSRKLIKTVRKYVEDHDESIALIFVNNQNQIIWERLNFEQKEAVYQQIVAEK